MDTLFSKIDSKLNFLSIFINDKTSEYTFLELVDPTKYESIDIITYVSNPKYFFEHVRDFKKVRLILGIEEKTNAQKFDINPESQNDFYKQLDGHILKKIAKNDIEIRFTPIGNSIHSKIYILKNQTQTLVLMGSANLTPTAMGNKRQFEELMGYDNIHNQAFVNNYNNRFNDIYDLSVDYVPDVIRNKIKSEEINLLQLSEEESIEILKENINKVNSLIAIDESISRDLQIEREKLFKNEQDSKIELQMIQKTKQLFEIITKKKDGMTVLITPKDVVKKQDLIISKVLKTEILKKEFEDNRTEVYYEHLKSKLCMKDGSSKELKILGTSINLNILKTKIDLLEKFIKAYSNFTVNNEIDTQKRIFEAILYSFMSSYIWKIREEYCKIDNRDEIKTSIPIYLLIAGQAQSGKTHLLRFISTITGNHGNYYHYKVQAKLNNMEQINPQVIDNFLHSENLTPTFVDEINKEYFSSNNSSKSSYMGESYIKNITNSKDGKHPCIISTSNTDFSANSQVMRRIYYIQLNNPFENQTNEMRDYFNSINTSFGTELYQDFIYRLEKKFDQGIKLNVDDFMYLGREIFSEYFEEIDMKNPSWFSTKPINDYYTRGSEIWQRKYLQNKKAFKEIKSHNEILLNEDLIFGTKMSANRDKKELLQFLPIGVIKEEKGIVRLNREKFFEFIGISSGYISQFLFGLIRKD